MAFNLQDFFDEIADLKRGAYAQLQTVVFNVASVMQPGQAVQVQISPCNSLFLVPQLSDGNGQVQSSSVTAAIMVRINGKGPWLPMSLGGGVGIANSIDAPIYQLEYYCSSQAPANPKVIMAVAALNVAIGTTAGGEGETAGLSGEGGGFE